MNIDRENSRGDLIEVIDASLKGLKDHPDGLSRKFEYKTPLTCDFSLRNHLKAFYNPNTLRPDNYVQLDSLNIIPQKTKADCVGAVSMSVFSAVTGIPVTDAMYDKYLEVCIKNGFAKELPQGVKVFPFVLNVLSFPVIKEEFAVEGAIVSYKRGLSLSEISGISRKAKKRERPYLHFALTPVSSWFDLGGKHLIALQELNNTGISVYDPNYTKQRQLTAGEFIRHWAIEDNAVIFVLARPPKLIP